MNSACNLACNVGKFSNECKVWKKLEPANQTLAEFQRIFAEAHQDLQESRAAARSSKHANYASQEYTALEVLTQLANTAAADRTTMATLTSKVQNLQEENIKLQSKVLAALERLAASKRTKLSVREPRERFRYYCWTCRTCSNHKGKCCRSKRVEHQDSAMAEDNLEGKQQQQGRLNSQVVIVHQVVKTDMITVVLIIT